jgi:HTH-type transcriptional regulator, transcriptional repressor of NAD biosynthesis genes
MHPDDAPFTQGGLREGERIRHWMTEAFVERLTSTGRQWAWLLWPGPSRVEAALQSLQALLEEGWGRSAPLPSAPPRGA